MSSSDQDGGDDTLNEILADALDAEDDSQADVNVESPAVGRLQALQGLLSQFDDGVETDGTPSPKMPGREMSGQANSDLNSKDCEDSARAALSKEDHEAGRAGVLRQQQFQLAQMEKALQLVRDVSANPRTDSVELKDFQLRCLGPVIPQELPANLTMLCLSGNAFESMEELSQHLKGLRNLRTLDLSHCRLSSLTCLPKLPLEKLDVSSNLLSSSAGIAKCAGLREVSFAKNRLAKTDQIEMLLNLVVLDLSENRLHSKQLLRPLTACSRLECLQIHGNPLASLAQAKHRAWVASMFPALIWLDEHAIRPQRLRKKGQPDRDNLHPDRSTAGSGAALRKDVKDCSLRTEYLEQARRYARPTISSKMQAVPTPQSEKAHGRACERELEPSVERVERAERKIRRTSAPRSGAFAPAARPQRSSSQPCPFLHRSSDDKRVSAAPAEPQLRDTHIHDARPRDAGNTTTTEPQQLQNLTKDTRCAAVSASMGMQSRHSSLCRELIEEKRRLLQQISAKLGEGVATAMSARPMPVVNNSVRAVPQHEDPGEIRSLCESLRKDIQRKRLLIKQTKQI